MILEMIARGWEDLIARLDGPLHLRFIVQPTMATIMAIRAGLQDARAGRSPYLWKVLTSAAHRGELLRAGWKHVRTIFLLAAVLDTIYQVAVHRTVYPLELLLTATLLALVPYLVLRGPVNRIVRLFSRGSGATGGVREDQGKRP